MTQRLRFKGYPSNILANTVGADREIIINTSTRGITVHDGSTPGGFVIASSNVTPNVTYTSVDDYARLTANSADANTILIQGVNNYQNTALSATDGKMQSAYDTANSALSNSGVISLIAGANITLSGSKGNVTISSTGGGGGTSNTDANGITYEQGYTVTGGSFVVGQQYLISSSGNTNFTSIGASSNTSGTYFTATGVGSGTGTAQLSRLLNLKIQELVSIKDFGATLNGTTSDQVAFVAAINSGASQVFINPGICYLTSSVTVPSTCALQFAYGAKIKIASGQTLTVNSQIIAENTILFVSPYSVKFKNNQNIKSNWLNV